MNKFEAIIFFLGISFAGSGDGWAAVSQIIPSHPILQGKAIHSHEVNHSDFHARHPEAKVGSKITVEAKEETETIQCFTYYSGNLSRHGEIDDVSPSIPQTELNRKCNLTFKSCNNGCIGSSEVGKSSSDNALQSHKNNQ